MTLPAHTPASSASPTLPLAVTRPVAVQPVPQAMEDVSSAQPSAFQSALDHAPVESTLAQLEASAIPAGAGEHEQEVREALGPVVFHTSPRKPEGKVQESTSRAQSTQENAPPSQSMTRQAGATTPSTTRSSSSGCCDDPATTYILWNDDGSCAAAINCCATGVLRSCQALARVPGAVRECLPSSQSLHNGCDTLVSTAEWCCKGFGDCLADSLGLVKDIICCPFTLCGQMCEACCKGLERGDCWCCCPSGDVCCCCSDCDCNGCDCNC